MNKDVFREARDAWILRARAIAKEELYSRRRPELRAVMEMKRQALLSHLRPIMQHVLSRWYVADWPSMEADWVSRMEKASTDAQVGRRKDVFGCADCLLSSFLRLF